MALEISGYVSEHGVPIKYWNLRGFAIRDELVKATQAVDREKFGTPRPLPGNALARVSYLQLQFDGYADKAASDLDAHPLAVQVVEVIGDAAFEIWKKLKTGEPTFPLMYAALKAKIASDEAKKIKHTFSGYRDA